MPTSGAWEVRICGGGQSAEGSSGLPLHQPAAPGARGPASGFGSVVSGQKGRNRTTGRRTGRRRIVGRSDVRGRTGDIAHLEPGQYFAFSSPCQVFSLFLRPSSSPCAPCLPSVLISPARTPAEPCSSGSFSSALSRLTLGSTKGSRASPTHHCWHPLLPHRRSRTEFAGPSPKACAQYSAKHSRPFAHRSFSGFQALPNSHHRPRQ